MNGLTKNVVLSVGLFGTITLVVMSILAFTSSCRSTDACLSFFIAYDPWYWANYIFITPFLLILSLVTYWLNQRVFEAWKKFVIFALPVVLILTWYSTRDIGEGGFFSLDFTLFFLGIIYGLFFLISIIIILIAWAHNRP